MSELKNYTSNLYINLKLYKPFCSINKNVISLDLKKDIDGLISNDKKILDLIYSRSLQIFNDLFDNEDDILFVINKYDEYQWEIIQSEDGSYDRKDLYDETTYTQKHIRINPYIHNKDSLKKLNCIVTDLGKINTAGIKNVHSFYTNCKVKDIRYRRLIRELIEDELVDNFKGIADYYIVHKEKEYVYHLCNDEWIDLSFNKDKDLEKFKEKYSKHID
ncbi:hypothetical protein CHL78_008260 [Romboutsia weinsteinii]|uniref:DUF3885 domain-containing protein n=1 Tax=Romboutsia weinsteinii TaxID=2020949 RepID=A0A371J4P2_9FIRM|nr:hypothetical protein [Romboutsia weinsteinii]RDY27705.1 hypothetical protein CHL78_008260 [Romboutsia weinsteinii]